MSRKTKGKVTGVSEDRNCFFYGESRVVSLEHAEQLTNMTVEQLRSKIGKMVTVSIDDKNRVIGINFDEDENSE